MGDEPEISNPFRQISEPTCRDIIAVLRSVYNGGYSKQRLTFEERRQLRAKAYRCLKAVGLEK